MKKRTLHFAERTRAGLSAAVLGAFLFLGADARAAIPPVEKLLPADTLVVIAAPDCTKLGEVFGRSPQFPLLNDPAAQLAIGDLASFLMLMPAWNDPAMKPFHDKFVTKLKEEFITPLERDLGVKLDDYASLPRGLVAFAITQNGWNGEDNQSPALLALLDTRDRSGQLKTNLAQLRKKWVDAGKPIRYEKIRDVEFSVVPLSSNDAPKTLTAFFPRRQEVQELGKETDTKNAPKDELVIGQFDSLLIVGSSIKAVEKVVIHLTGGSAPALADEPAFEANRLAFFRDAPFYGWFNAKVFLDVFLRAPPEKPNPQAPSILPSLRPDKFISALGLSGLKTVAFDLRDSSDGSVSELFFGVPEASRQGLFKILTAEAKDANPPPFVPADAVKFQRWRMDGQKAWAALEKMLTDVSLQSTLSFLVDSANSAAQEKDPSYDMKKNLVGNLGDDIITYEKAPRGSSPAEIDSPPSLLLIGSPNAEQLAAALKGPLFLVTPQAATPDVREFLGRKIYTVTLSSLPMAAVTGGPSKLMYAASGGYVAFSTDTSMVEEFLRSGDSQAKALRETAGLTDAAQKVGGAGAGLFGYENQSERVRVWFESLKKETGAATNSPAAFNPLAGTLPFAGPEKNLKAWMDYSLLPGFDKVAKYFGYTVYSGSATVDGLTYRLFAPVPPQLKK